MKYILIDSIPDNGDRMKLYASLFILLATVFSSFAMNREHLRLLAIVSLDNHSREQVRIAEKNRAEIVKKLSRKDLRKSFLIPFISINTYREQFLRDEPYIPCNALLIKTLKGVFAVWESEIGIFASQQCLRDSHTQQECRAQKIFRSINGDNERLGSTDLLQAQLFLLNVTAEGDLALQDLVRGDECL